MWNKKKKGEAFQIFKLQDLKIYVIPNRHPYPFSDCDIEECNIITNALFIWVLYFIKQLSCKTLQSVNLAVYIWVLNEEKSFNFVKKYLGEKIAETLRVTWIRIVWENPSSKVPLSGISVTYSHLQSENVKWKIPEKNNALVLNCELFWAVWGSPTSSILPKPMYPHCSCRLPVLTTLALSSALVVPILVIK